MEKDNLVYLQQIRDYINDIEGYVKDENLAEFEKDIKLQDAVLRKLSLIGEAARRLDERFWDKYRDELPLAEAVATRNKLIHDYDDIDLRIVWNTVKKDLVELKRRVEVVVGNDQ